ncbi:MULTISPECIES: ChaN family lipoprotein [unclassified Delftia]|uniref:ChaN family lipoprotein n=1 Tax=unclassified Delftia TaxID=2613839 RepID=UPI001901B41D|nr:MULTISPECIES: ChaN family lipoprotein [unclassified Delftia]MBK0112401.1 ChaN family lipoprotein [Delftia sp. S65]MBK0118384.1 ChaN family lipoprotein [Delftia sp. S67]MBK0129952.1 ChaN family lipoprotein [Delftia sp. S66]
MQVRSIPRPFIRTPRLAGLAAAALLAAALAGCASSSAPARDWTQQLQRWSDAPIVLLGEQHDAVAHQAWQQATVEQLAKQERLAALVIEMAPRTGSTASLARDASEDAVQQALQWQDAAWPWPRYRGVVMAAVRAGVPVLGGNLPRADMKQAMRNENLDTHLPPEGWQRQLDAIREGHCGLLPDTQLVPMARIQLARDASMAEVARAAVKPGKTVLLVAGRGHVLRGVGIPSWLPEAAGAKVAVAQAGETSVAQASDVDWLQKTDALPAKDHCAELREKFRNPPAPRADAG